jgi:hypothetical protein
MLLKLILILLNTYANAYTVIIPSTGAPAGTEQSLIAQTTTYFNTSLTVNPLFPDTYQINLFGPAVSQFQLLIDSDTYAFVYGEGVEDQRQTDIQSIIGPTPDCMQSPFCVNRSGITVPTDFLNGNSSYTVVVDSATCFAVVCTISANIYEQGLSSPP